MGIGSGLSLEVRSFKNETKGQEFWSASKHYFLRVVLSIVQILPIELVFHFINEGEEVGMYSSKYAMSSGIFTRWRKLLIGFAKVLINEQVT